MERNMVGSICLNINTNEWECPYKVCPVEECGENLYGCDCNYADFILLSKVEYEKARQARRERILKMLKGGSDDGQSKKDAS